MPELDEELDTLDQADDAPTGETDTEELPDDAEALKARIKENQRQAQQAVKAAQREAERQKQRADEERAGKVYWHTEATKQQANATPGGQPQTKPSGKPATDETLETALAGLDLADFVADEKGVTKLVAELVKRNVLMTPAQVQTMLDQRVTQEQAASSEQALGYQELVESYPDMADRNSPLSTEAYAELESVAREKPHWKPHEQLVEATRRAAQALAVEPGKPGTARTAAPSRERLRNAQGGPANRGGNPQNPKPVVTADLAKMATKTAGGALPPDVLARVAKTVAANQRRSRQ